MKNELIQVSDTVRVERGPKRKRGKATAKLLDDAVTADHYHLPREETKVDKDGKTRTVVKKARDSAGRVIEKEGQEIEYLDWKGEHVWYVYQLQHTEDEMLDENGKPTNDESLAVETRPVHRYVKVDEQPTKEWALAAAKKLEV